MRGFRHQGELFKCPICSKSLMYVLHVHAENHNMSLMEYYNKYPQCKKFIIDKKITGGKQKWLNYGIGYVVNAVQKMKTVMIDVAIVVIVYKKGKGD